MSVDAPRRVDRQIEQHAGLDVLIGFLLQPYLAAECGFPGQARAPHRLAAYRLRHHVEVQRTAIPPVERREVEDAAVLGPFALRPDRVIKEAGLAHVFDVRGQFRRRHEAGEADALDARKVFLQGQGGDVGGPVVRGDFVRRDEQRPRTPQHLAIGAHALFHLQREIACFEIEPFFDPFVMTTVDFAPYRPESQ